MQQMETLPPKYLKPIIMQGKNSVIQRKTITLAVKIWVQIHIQMELKV